MGEQRAVDIMLAVNNLALSTSGVRTAASDGSDLAQCADSILDALRTVALHAGARGAVADDAHFARIEALVGRLQSLAEGACVTERAAAECKRFAQQLRIVAALHDMR